MKSVVICGSSKFATEAMAFGAALEELGVVVYVPHFYRASGGDWDRLQEFDKPFVALGLTLDHFAKIRMADVVFVYNKNGYAGNSTTLEIGYAVACNKPIYVLHGADAELCRKVLFRGVATTPAELVKVL